MDPIVAKMPKKRPIIAWSTDKILAKGKTEILCNFDINNSSLKRLLRLSLRSFFAMTQSYEVEPIGPFDTLI